MRVEGRRTGEGTAGADGRLRAVLRLNLALLVGLAALSLVLPLSETERWFVAVSAAVLAGIDWALMGRAAR